MATLLCRGRPTCFSLPIVGGFRPFRGIGGQQSSRHQAIAAPSQLYPLALALAIPLAGDLGQAVRP
ncbi:MAG TPA: hypothetical protein VEZ50_04525 [Nodosilinea sp.]|nr:hypothetical protein [Nodosilinea sp.]